MKEYKVVLLKEVSSIEEEIYYLDEGFCEENGINSLNDAIEFVKNSENRYTDMFPIFKTHDTSVDKEYISEEDCKEISHE